MAAHLRDARDRLSLKSDGGIFMAIRNVVMDRRDSADYRNHLKRGGFLSASYLSISGFDAVRLKKLALQGKLDAIGSLQQTNLFLR